MLRLKTTVAACLALAAIGGIIAFSSQPAKSGSGDAKTSFDPNAVNKSASAATIPAAAGSLPSAKEIAQAPEAAAASAAGGKKPNVVILMTDDTGWNDFGCYGGGENLGHATPHVDRLAKGAQCSRAGMARRVARLAARR